MADLVDVQLVRPVQFGGIARAAGETVTVPPSVASELIVSGRGRLVDAADLGLIVDAEEARRPGLWCKERPRWPRMLTRR